MTIHKLKTIEPSFTDIKLGNKKADVRFDDRNFQVGDRLDLFQGDEPITEETRIDEREHLHVFVTHKLEGGQFGIEKGYCVLSISFDEP